MKILTVEKEKKMSNMYYIFSQKVQKKKKEKKVPF